MADRIRTFIAIDVPVETFRDVLSDLRDMGRPIKVLSEPLHLTLKFLGDTNRKDVPQIAGITADVASACPAFDLEICGLGAFPRIERPSVIWAGFTPGDLLAALAQDLEIRLEPLGFRRESRAFHPHVTLARVKGRPPAALTSVFDLYADATFGEMPVNQVLLYQSELTPAGPVYSILSTSSLQLDE